MKAIRVEEFGGPEVLRLEEVPDLRPGPGQVLVKIHAAGVNPVETYLRANVYPKKMDLPWIPGTDGAGVVEAVGGGVKRVKPGDRVYIIRPLTGTYAEYALCEEWAVQPLPSYVSFAQGAAIAIPYGTAYRAIFQRAHAQAGDIVLVHGASGGVGIAAVQFARAAGMRVIGTAGTERGLKLVLAEGAHEALDHKSQGYLEKAYAMTDGHGFDIIVEMLANVNLNKDLPILARNGRVVVVGNRGTVEINPREAMSRDAAILGMSLMFVTEHDLHAIHAAIVAGLEAKTLRPVVGQEIPLAEAPRSHVAVMEPGAHGKIVLVP
jgi:NADPH:quinone reductase